MPRIELDQLINSKGIDAPLVILLNWFYSQFDNRNGANHRIANMEFLHYTGIIAGSEFLTYAATKLYICYNCQIFNSTPHGEVEGLVTFYNQANAVFLNTKNQQGYWEVVGAKDEFMINPLQINHFYFSRLAATIYDSFIFNGYRVTLV
jgi:hypothetical protein